MRHRRPFRRRGRAATGAILLLLLGAAGGCQSPAIRRDYDEAAKTLTVTAGPIRVGALGLAGLVVWARLREPFEPPDYVMVRLSLDSFDEVHFIADGKKYSFRRALFEEAAARVRASAFAEIAQSRHITVRFDDDTEGDDLTEEEIELLARFARGLRLGTRDATR